LRKWFCHGLWPKLVADSLAGIAAIRGDAQLTADRLAFAIDSESVIGAMEILNNKAYDTVRDDPAVQVQFKRLRSKEDALRDRLFSEGIW